MFYVKFHRHVIPLLLIVLTITIGGYFVVFTSTMVDGIRPGPWGIITLSKGAEYVFVGQLIVFVCTAIIVITLIRSYRSARSNHAQIKNVYALAAALVYDLSCLYGLYYSYPLIMATRGIVFYIVVLLILQRNKFFDIRPTAPITLEARTLRDFGKIFRDYAGEDIGHRESIKLIERKMVAYKLEKISGFKEGTGSSLPHVADSMGIKLSSLYDTLKRLELKKPLS